MEKYASPSGKDSTSSGSSIPDNLNLIDGEIEIVQQSKLLSEEDKIMPGTTLHSIKVHDRDRKLMAKCSTVSTEWAVELQSSFLGEGRLLVRKVSPGVNLSHIYDNQEAYDRVTIRAHLTVRGGGTIYEGYFCRSQRLSNPLEHSNALRQLKAVRRGARSNFKKLGITHSLPVIDQQRASVDVPELRKLSLGNSSSNPTLRTPLNANGTVPCEEVPGQLLSPSGDNEPIQMTRESQQFNEGTEAQGWPKEKGSSARNTSKTSVGPPGAANKKALKVNLPDPKSVPKAVMEVRGFGDVLANKKVINYLNHLEDGAATINSHLGDNMEVSNEDIESLGSASSAILREYGYDFPESRRIHRNGCSWRRPRKTPDPRKGTESSSSESDVSNGELKSEVVKRALEGRDFSELLGLLKDSKEWRAADDWTHDGGAQGKIERKIQQHFS